MLVRLELLRSGSRCAPANVGVGGRSGGVMLMRGISAPRIGNATGNFEERADASRAAAKTDRRGVGVNGAVVAMLQNDLRSSAYRALSAGTPESRNGCTRLTWIVYADGRRAGT